MDLGLEGKPVIVTGAGRNIGRAIALAFAQEGAKVVVADIDGASARRVADEIVGAGGDAMAATVAVDDPKLVQAMVDETLARYGRIEVLVNNAAINSKTPTHEMKLERWQQTIQVNLTGVFNCCQAVMKPMMEQRSGRIVSIGSVNAFVPFFSDVAYVATKAGLVGLTRKLARDLAPYSVTCNVVAPSMVLTEMSQQTLKLVSLEEMVSRFPLGRLCRTEDVVGAVLFLSSAVAGFITGQVIHVNGGAYMA